jgi:uncharacterized protein (TIGR02996 family)
MIEEGTFIAAICASPADDAPRLAFADWLEEQGQSDRAELIRIQCRLDPDRDRYEDPAVNALRDRVRDLLRPADRAESDWTLAVTGQRVLVEPDWRRGFVDTLRLSAQTFLGYGEQLRERYPLLRSLVLFRLNGWGARLAQCPWLRGIRELDLACWYADDDARALAASPHLGAVERVVCWSGGGLEQGRILARGPAWGALKNLHLVARENEHAEGWVAAVNEAAARPVGSVHVVGNELFPIAADFDHEGHYVVGKLPDGTQLFMMAYLYDDPDARFEGVAFDADGTPRAGPFHYPLSPQVADQMRKATDPWDWAKWRRALEVRDDYLRQQLSFDPAMIRVKSFEFHSIWGLSRLSADAEEAWGRPDPHEEGGRDSDHPLGHGGWVYSWVTDGMYQISGGNSPWCDASGHITST